MELGKKLRKLRKEKRMTIKNLSEKAGISQSMISKIERDQTSPTIATLWRIGQALDISLGDFLDNQVGGVYPVVRKEERKKLFFPGTGVSYELLSPHLKGNLEFLCVVIEPGETSEPEQISHEGEECGVVVKGKLKIRLGAEEYYLNEGDSIYFSSRTPHRYINVGDEVAISYWAITPPSFLGES